jgi:hypothetical protein
MAGRASRTSADRILEVASQVRPRSVRARSAGSRGEDEPSAVAPGEPVEQGFGQPVASVFLERDLPPQAERCDLPVPDETREVKVVRARPRPSHIGEPVHETLGEDDRVPPVDVREPDDVGVGRPVPPAIGTGAEEERVDLGRPVRQKALRNPDPLEVVELAVVFQDERRGRPAPARIREAARVALPDRPDDGGVVSARATRGRGRRRPPHYDDVPPGRELRLEDPDLAGGPFAAVNGDNLCERRCRARQSSCSSVIS